MIDTRLNNRGVAIYSLYIHKDLFGSRRLQQILNESAARFYYIGSVLCREGFGVKVDLLFPDTSYDGYVLSLASRIRDELRCETIEVTKQQVEEEMVYRVWSKIKE